MKDHDLKRDQLAVCLMVMDEWGEGEDPNLHVPFFANFLAKQRDTEHSGDCKKEPWSCSRCICDEYLKKADELLSAFPQPAAEADEPCHGPQDTYCPSCGLGVAQ